MGEQRARAERSERGMVAAAAEVQALDEAAQHGAAEAEAARAAGTAAEARACEAEARAADAEARAAAAEGARAAVEAEGAAAVEARLEQEATQVNSPRVISEGQG